ncbi:MAG: TolC family protein [Puniceicoccales bacterium]|nr:TolC family protein [Puniceicoccales bacterium]
MRGKCADSGGESTPARRTAAWHSTGARRRGAAWRVFFIPTAAGNPILRRSFKAPAISTAFHRFQHFAQLHLNIMNRSAHSENTVSAKRRHLAPLAILPLLFAAGCAVGPDFEPPKVESPKTWRDAAPAAATDAPTIANLPWWEIFKDPALQTLVNEALDKNKDLHIALARLDAARAAAGISNAAYYPSIGYSATAFHNDPKAGQLTNPHGYTLGGTINWELDLWGRVRRINETATARYFATAEARNSVVLSIVSGVASAYFNLRALDAKLAIAQRTLETRREVAKLARLKLEKDVGNEIDPLQFEAEMLSAQADVLEFRRAIAELENAISVLLGRTPGPIKRAAVADNIAAILPKIPAGVPSEILHRRPDLRAAEFELKAANAQIGAAVAGYFPKITLTGILAFVNPQLKGLVDHNSKYTQGGGSLLGPLFDAGATYYSVEGAKASTREALLAYEKAVLTAFQEVNDSLTSLQISRERIGHLQTLVSHREKVLSKLNEAEQNGTLSKFPVLDADRYLYAAQLALVDAKTADQLYAVRLYKALGGGWRSADLKKPLIDNRGKPSDCPSKNAPQESPVIKKKD